MNQDTDFPLRDFTRRIHLATDANENHGFTLAWNTSEKRLELSIAFTENNADRTITLNYPIPDDEAFRHQLAGLSLGLSSLIAAISRDLA